ncbi:aminodeoxychorismate lyase [Thioalkalivibrio sp. XN8]|uniref:aminodeoxychorismate lyase n=1 Tax=Thioalkalivibrio sp. XN8 TaxID=2712863 RepID=UPI001F0D6DF0|nr:aminodeoxychorismate lyase [Thioalkalivibrio sp. XN8]
MLVDGRPAGSVPLTDRGLNYGDGLFETLRLHRGAAPLLDRHLARLQAGCERLGLGWPGRALLEPEALAVAAAAPGEAVLKIVLTRGDGGRGYAPGPVAPARRIISAHPLPPGLGTPLEVGVCRTRLGSSPALQGLKHLGRLEQVLAASETAAAGWDEGLMLDAAGRVIEGTRHHVFFLRGDRLFTPPLAGLAVAGIMRAMLLEALPALGLDGGEAELRYDALHEVDAMYLGNAVAGVRAVSRLDGRPLPEPGLLDRLHRALSSLGVTWLA